MVFFSMMWMMLIMIISTSFIISSFSYWTMWLGLEFFNFFFIPWLVEGENSYKSSKIFLYFIIQVIASGTYMVGVANSSSMYFFFLMIISMMIKLGSFPFHLWVLEVIENMNWKKFSFFMTMTKMGPISVLYMMNPPFLLAKLLWGGLMTPLWGLKTMSIRKMLTFSSISQMSWIITCITLSKSLLWFFLAIYWPCFIMCSLFFDNFLIKSTKDLLNSSYKIFHLSIILTLMGFPPFLGFFPKVYTLKIMCMKNMISESIFLSVLSILPFFFYLKMMIMMVFSYNLSNTSFFSLKANKKSVILAIMLITSVEFLCFFCM